MTNEQKDKKKYFIRVARYLKFSATVEIETESACDAARIYHERSDRLLNAIPKENWECEGMSECWGAQQIEDDPDKPYEETEENYSLVLELTPPRLVNPNPVVDIFD